MPLTTHAALAQFWMIRLAELRALRAGAIAASPEIWAARGQPRAAGDVSIVPIMGSLSQRGGWYGMSYEGIRTAFRNAMADGSKAVVLQFDSPGGEVYGVDELASEIRAARGAAKPIVAAVDPLAASAAYYLASQADEIIVTPSGEIGSIGVYGMHEDWSRAIDEFGVTVTLVSAGEGKTDGNMFEPLSDAARADMQGAIDRYYAMFASAASKGRRVGVDVVRSQWKAKVYGAKESIDIGMADSVGTVDDAVRRAATLAQQRRAVAASVDLEVETRRRARNRVG